MLRAWATHNHYGESASNSCFRNDYKPLAHILNIDLFLQRYKGTAANANVLS